MGENNTKQPKWWIPIIFAAIVTALVNNTAVIASVVWAGINHVNLSSLIVIILLVIGSSILLFFVFMLGVFYIAFKFEYFIGLSLNVLSGDEPIFEKPKWTAPFEVMIWKMGGFVRTRRKSPVSDAGKALWLDLKNRIDLVVIETYIRYEKDLAVQDKLSQQKKVILSLLNEAPRNSSDIEKWRDHLLQFQKETEVLINQANELLATEVSQEKSLLEEKEHD